MAEKLKYKVDKSGKLSNVFLPILKREFPILKHVNILFTWRNIAKWDDDGRPTAAEARRCSNKERDLYGFDFEVNVLRDNWDGLNTFAKVRLAWHELNHCVVVVDEDGKPSKDDCGKTMISIEPHDLIIRSFKEEVNKFGLSPVDISPSKFLYKEWKKRKKMGDKYIRRMKRYKDILD